MQASASMITAAALGVVLVFNVVLQSPGWMASKVVEKTVHREPHYPPIPRGWTVDRMSAATLQVSACLACFSCVVSAYLIEQWLVVGLAVAGTITSFFYWREPVFHGLARKLDVIVILAGLNCHFYLLATGAATGSAVSVCVAGLLYAGGILAFMKSPGFREAGQPIVATLLHMTLHWLGSAANFAVHFLFELHPHALTLQTLGAPAVMALVGGTGAMAYRILTRSNKKLEEVAVVEDNGDDDEREEQDLKKEE